MLERIDNYMKILAVGDVIGTVGKNMLKEYLAKIKEENQIDFTIVNGENSADGLGITKIDLDEIYKYGADAVTLGNHTWAKRDIFKFIDHETKLIRPANYNEGVPGKGYQIFSVNNKKIAVISLIGRVDIDVLSENPFLKVQKIISKIRKEIDIIVVDFHAEATAEKIAMGYFLDGKANILFGTHTHVQTADEKVLNKGLGYITDIGMTGPKHSVIGMEVDIAIKRFTTGLPERYKMALGDGIFNGCIFEINDKNNQIEKVNRISF